MYVSMNAQPQTRFHTCEDFGISAARKPQSGSGAMTRTDPRYTNKKIPSVRYHPDMSRKRPEEQSHTPDKNIQVKCKHVVSPSRPIQVRYHPDMTRKRPEERSHTPDKSIQVKCKPVVFPSRPIQVRYHPDMTRKRPEEHQQSPTPDKNIHVKCKPAVSPRPTQVIPHSDITRKRPEGQSPTRDKNIQVKCKQVVYPSRPVKVKECSMVSPQRPTQAKERSAVSPTYPVALTLGLGQKMDKHFVELVELKTRGQRENPKWFEWRQNRITASAAHRIAHSRFVTGKSQTPPTSYLEAITGRGPSVKTRAMTWGIEHEAEAVQRYQVLKSKALGRMLKVQECGLFIDPQRPWLAGSPDGIVEDQRTGERLLCLEVKCPYKHRENTVTQACMEDKDFCLVLQEEGQVKYSLKSNHSYYTQIQCQLAVTGLTRADLVVFTLKETAIVPVTFDPAFWNNTLAKLEKFYTEAVLPYIKDNGRDAATMRPEE
ncbi:hypothetical protein DPEC_G00247320 [Dallia pectoralis]|uniref:Uncharacterized protein n=1 Tax=Dallia pectoralis TaxID=75939 RepID=A0ACC2FWT9_DALPE|nr:hypothetical protein DPEC_G00247320 [Dallia pectoralis]